MATAKEVIEQHSDQLDQLLAPSQTHAFGHVHTAEVRLQALAVAGLIELARQFERLANALEREFR